MFHRAARKPAGSSYGEIGPMSESHSEGIQSTPTNGASQGIQTGHGHGASHALPASPFTDAEIARFQRQDRYAGGAVAVLMGSIFSIGVVLYSIVLYTVYLAGLPQ
jgi:hypothetical protein